MSQVAASPERVEVIISFENRVEVADQEETGTASNLTAEQVPRALHFSRHPDPLGIQPERIEFPPHYLTDLADALVIHRAAADIDRFREQREGRFGVCIYPVDHPALDCRELGARKLAEQKQNCAEASTLRHGSHN